MDTHEDAFMKKCEEAILAVEEMSVTPEVVRRFAVERRIAKKLRQKAYDVWRSEKRRAEHIRKTAEAKLDAACEEVTLAYKRYATAHLKLIGYPRPVL